jgi:hypothetical protein
MTLAPIAIFLFNRKEHLRRTLNALLNCPGFAESDIYVYCDGPRNPGDREAVSAAREEAKRILGDRAAFVERSSNIGLANSIVSGVSELCERYGRVIVLEDDLVVAPGFVRFMNDALNAYADVDIVMQVSGHAFHVPAFEEKATAVMLPFITSWGWGTWKRAWAAFDFQCHGWELLKRDKKLRHRFNIGGAYDYYSMLRGRMDGRNNSWAIAWNWAVFRVEGIVAYPPRSFVTNIGFDGTGTHGWRSGRRLTTRPVVEGEESVRVSFPRQPRVQVEEYELVRSEIRRFQGGWLAPLKFAARRLTRAF